MTAFRRPTSTASISDTFAEHVARRSVNPGVDYIPGYGAPVYAPEAGRVIIADGNPDGAGGRVVCIDFDNGYGCDLLHLSAIAVSRGDRVTKGQRVGWVGGSGYGANHYYGSHLHISLRHNHVHLINDGNLDFEHVYRNQTTTAGSGGTPLPDPAKPPPIENEDPMTDTIYQARLNTSGGRIDGDSAPRTKGVPAGEHIVEPLACYYQERPGAPLQLVQAGAPYNPLASKTKSSDDYKNPPANVLEREAFSANGGKTIEARIDHLAALVVLRGLVE